MPPHQTSNSSIPTPSPPSVLTWSKMSSASTSLNPAHSKAATNSTLSSSPLPSASYTLKICQGPGGGMANKLF